jgi:hypothetical protein
MKSLWLTTILTLLECALLAPPVRHMAKLQVVLVLVLVLVLWQISSPKDTVQAHRPPSLLIDTTTFDGMTKWMVQRFIIAEAIVVKVDFEKPGSLQGLSQCRNAICNDGHERCCKAD